MLHSVQVDGVIVGAELLSLEKVDRCLVQLEDHDLVEEVEALDISLRPRYGLSQLRDFVHFPLFGAEKRAESVFSTFHFLYSINVRAALLDLSFLAFLHLGHLVDGFEDGLEVENLELEPTSHDREWVLKLLRELYPAL